ncbi:hypothetical protein ACHAWX_007775 [Stephanocyclus meneghinianus]
MKRAAEPNESGSQSSHKDDEASLEDTLEALPQLLKKRQKALEEREQELERKVAAFEKETGHMNAQLPNSDVLELNVGGTITTVLRRTLTSVEGSMLASRFSGRWDDTLEKDKNGNFFIDQPIHLFQPMIDYLRARNSETPLGPPVTSPDEFENETQRRNFVRMVEYFGMTPGIYPTVMEICRGEPTTAEISGHPNLGVSSSEWATFTLGTKGHNRPITSFSVILGQVERAQIGWVRSGHFVRKLRPGDHKGVGEEKYSFGLDCCRGGLLYEGKFTRIEGFSTSRGTVIRCENKGARWLVNGRVVASSLALDETFQLPPDLQQYHLVPAFSGKGDWKICEVELDPLVSEHKSTQSHHLSTI